jgi:hypothetical protein
LAAGLRDYYKPQSIVEEILLEKIVIETARYGRVLALEQPEPGKPVPYLLHCLDKTMRYTTSTSRALSQAIKELETIQAARKAREESSASMDAELAKLPAECSEGQPEKQDESHASSGSRAFTTPARAEKKE